MKTIFIAITLMIFLSSDKDLKTILRDGQFSKIPKGAKITGKEVLDDDEKRYGYLVFESTPDQINEWIIKSKLTPATVTEIFDKEIVVWPGGRPVWFRKSYEKLDRGEIYYAKREKGHFTAICLIDRDKKVIHIEYEIRQ